MATQLKSGEKSAAVRAFAITPSDDDDLHEITRGIYVGVSGDLTVEMNGVNITFVDIAAGVIHPIRVTKVLDTGTDATDIVGLV